MNHVRLPLAIRILCMVIVVGVGVGMYRWVAYYQTHITPSVLRNLQGKELQEVIYAMVRSQPMFLVNIELKQAFPQELPWMHIIGHYIGEETYRRHGLSAIGMCDTNYNFGCYHGVVQYVARLHGPDPVFLEKLYNACIDQTQSSANCSDPLGHASATLVDFDIPKALQLCDKFFSIPNEQMHCGLGVFMEYFNTYRSTLFPKERNDRALIGMCDMYPTIYKTGCVELSLTYITDEYAFSMPKLISHCRNFTEQVVLDRCLYGVGAIAAKQYLSNGIDPVPVCVGIVDYFDSCMIGILRTYQSVDQSWRVAPLCSMLKEKDSKHTCEIILNESSRPL